MNKVCKFKCQINGKWYYVYECVHPDDERRTCYRTYVGRKRLDIGTWPNLGGAIGSILCEVEGDVLKELMFVWQ